MLALETLARRMVPRSAHHQIVRLYYAIAAPVIALLKRGDARQCPLCYAKLKCFEPKGKRLDVRCVVCGALKRHRLVWLYMTRRTNLHDGRSKTMLHVAPEPPMTRALRRVQGLGYITADLDSPFAEEKMDIRKIERPDGSFDVIYCSHVLEHIQEDDVAVAELFRVLRPGGWAILQVPITARRTDCNPNIVTPAARRKAYGHPGHVRVYGPDYQNLLREAGFDVVVADLQKELGPEQVTYFGLDPREKVYFCTKPQSELSVV
jgi:SAM-dependent methyltransferase